MPAPKIIAVTSGDPSGIGPEICLKVLDHPQLQDCRLVLLGDRCVFQQTAQVLMRALPPIVDSLDAALAAVHDSVPAVLLDVNALEGRDSAPGTVSAATGEASYRYITAAIDAALARRVDAVATGPIHKEALFQAGVKYPGHTEIFAARTHSERACMMLTCDDLTCSFVTTHVGYREVPGLLSVDRIVEVIQLSYEAMRRIRRREPQLLICGLNPHAGENGLFGGGEEEALIIPAVELARRRGIEIIGPLPPDTAFLPVRRRQADCIICMYHDQGHIPLKTLAFDRAVNTTLGLPIIRTSVDHGTALDIAGKGIADESSLVEAIRLASRLVESKEETSDDRSETATTMGGHS